MNNPAPDVVSKDFIERMVNGIGGGTWANGALTLSQDELESVIKGVANIAIRNYSTPAAPVVAEGLDASSLIKLWKQAEAQATNTMPAPFQFARLLLAAPAAPTDAKADALTRLDVMSLIHSQCYRAYASAIDREDIDTKYMREIEDAIMGIYHGRYIAGYDLRKSEDEKSSAPTAAQSVRDALEQAAKLADSFGPSRRLFQHQPSPLVRGRWEGEQAASVEIANRIRALIQSPRHSADDANPAQGIDHAKLAEGASIDTPEFAKLLDAFHGSPEGSTVCGLYIQQAQQQRYAETRTALVTHIDGRQARGQQAGVAEDDKEKSDDR